MGVRDVDPGCAAGEPLEGHGGMVLCVRVTLDASDWILVVNSGGAEIERVLQKFEGGTAVGAPYGGLGDGDANVPEPYHRPTAEEVGVGDLDVPLAKKHLGEGGEIRNRDPGAAEKGINLGRGQVLDAQA